MVEDTAAARRISTGSPFETEFAYSRAVVRGDWCFVSGTTGYDYARMSMPETVEDQARNALATIARTLEEAGFAMSDVVRARYFIVDAGLRQDIAPVLREVFAAAPPAASMIVAGLNEPEMKIEIEATAFRG